MLVGVLKRDSDRSRYSDPEGTLRKEKHVEFSAQVETILVAQASEYRNWGIWYELWYSNEDYADFFQRATRKVRFDNEVKIILVATIEDYANWGLVEEIWYNDDDYRRFHIERKCHLDSIKARKLMEFTDSIPSPTNEPDESKEDGKYGDSFEDFGPFDRDTYSPRRSYEIFLENCLDSTDERDHEIFSIDHLSAQKKESYEMNGIDNESSSGENKGFSHLNTMYRRRK